MNNFTARCQHLEQKAKALAEKYGRDWTEMCGYDRETYKDEVRKQEENESQYSCPFCGTSLPNAEAPHCGEAGHAEEAKNQLLNIMENWNLSFR